MSETPVSATRTRRGFLRRLLVWSGFACFTFLVFVVAAVVTMPVAALRNLVAVPPQIQRLDGTLLQGSASLVGGYVVTWDGQLSALILARLVADVTLQGADTLLTGQVGISPWSQTVENLDGRVGPGLFALVPDLPLDTCTMGAVIDGVNLSATAGSFGASGRAQVPQGTCTDFGGRTIPVPDLALALTTQGNDALFNLTGPEGALAQVSIAGDRRLVIRVEPVGARLVPGMPSSGPTMLEYPF